MIFIRSIYSEQPYLTDICQAFDGVGNEAVSVPPREGYANGNLRTDYGEWNLGKMRAKYV